MVSALALVLAFAGWRAQLVLVLGISLGLAWVCTLYSM